MTENNTRQVQTLEEFLRMFFETVATSGSGLCDVSLRYNNHDIKLGIELLEIDGFTLEELSERQNSVVH